MTTQTSAPIGSTGQSLEGVAVNTGAGSNLFRESVVVTDPMDPNAYGAVVSTQPGSSATPYGPIVWLAGSPNISSTVNISTTVNVSTTVNTTTGPIQITSSIPLIVAQSSAAWITTPAADVGVSSSLVTSSQTAGPFPVNAGYPTIGIQFSSSWTGNITLERTIDGANWENAPASMGNDVVTTVASNGIYVFPVGAAQQVRWRTESSFTGFASWSAFKSLGMQVIRFAAQLPSGSNNIGSVNITGTTRVNIVSSIPLNVSFAGTSQVFGSVSTQVVSSIPIIVAQTSGSWLVNGAVAVTNVPTVNVTNVPLVTVQGTSSVNVLGLIPGTTFVSVSSTNVHTVTVQGTSSVNVLTAIPGTSFVSISSSVPLNVSFAGTSQVFGSVSTQIVSSIPIFVSQSSAPWSMSQAGTSYITLASTQVSIGGGTQYLQGTATTTPTGSVSMALNANTTQALRLDASNNLLVNVAAGGTAGTQYLDPTTTTNPTGTIAMGLLNNTTKAIRFDASNNLLVNVAAGGTAGTQYVDPTTTTNPTGTVAMGLLNNTTKALLLDASQNLMVNVAAGGTAGTQYLQDTSTTAATGTVAMGLSFNSTVSGFRLDPRERLQIVPEYVQIFFESFDANPAVIETTNRWLTPVTTGVAAIVTSFSATGSVRISSATTNAGTAQLKSRDTFPPIAPGFQQLQIMLQTESTVVTSTYRAFGFGVVPATPTISTRPFDNGMVFEIGITGKMFAATYINSTRVQIADLSSTSGNSTQPFDGLPHNYLLTRRGNFAYWSIDDRDNIVAQYSSQLMAPAQTGLPIALLAICDSTGAATSAVMTAYQVYVGDNGQNVQQIGDVLYPWRRVQVNSSNTMSVRLVELGSSGAVIGQNMSTGITVFGTTAIFVGQTTAARSMPVVLASNVTSNVLVSGTTGAFLSAVSTGGANSTSFNALLNTLNTTVIKSGAGNIYGFVAANQGSTNVYIRFYNLSTAALTIASTAVPRYVIGLPVSSASQQAFDIGINYSSGITILAQQEPFTASTPTAPAASSVSLTILYQ